jgi:hypothetical protein
MIERNLGNAERILRLLLGIGLFAWAFLHGANNLVDWFAIVVSIALVLNGIFSRCYLWYLLDINTCPSNDGDCRPEPTCP